MTVRCGHKTHDFDLAAIHHHESVAMVRMCFSLERGSYSLEEQADYEEQSRQADAEYEAERRNERWFENGGHLAEVIAHENEMDRLRGLFYGDPQAQ